MGPCGRSQIHLDPNSGCDYCTRGSQTIGCHKMPARFFRKQDVSSNHLYQNIGRTAERPFIIKAMMKETSLGDLMGQMAALAAIKSQFDYAELHVRFRDIRPYSREIMTLVPEIDQAVGIRGHLPVWARLGLPDTRLWHPMARALDGNKGSWASFCDLCVSDWMVNPRMIHAIPNSVPFRIPPERVDTLTSQLIDAGVDPDHWFAVVHYRASNYLSKSSGQLRNGEPGAYQHLVDHIIDQLGGQVVQLGHPELEPFPARDGFVDLSRKRNSLMLQAFAASKARFMIAGPSGALGFGWGFHVPTGLVDASDAVGGWGPAEQVILTHEVTTPDGRCMRNRELMNSDLLDYPVLRDKIRAGENYQVRKNSGSELSAVSDHLHAATATVTGWRPPAAIYDGPRPNHIMWPPQTSENLNFIDV